MSNNLPKLALFIFAILVYLYVYDPSFIQFLKSAKAASKFQLNDRFILNTVVWMLGFWGMILLLNARNTPVKLLSWLFFIITTFIEFSYVNILNKSFSLENIDQLETVSKNLSALNSIDVMKFCGLTIVMAGIAFATKPTVPDITKTFAVVLILAITLATVAHKGHGVVLPTFYLVPALIIYKYALILTTPIEQAHPKTVKPL